MQLGNLIGIGGGVSRAPATPPGMRVRTGRFEKLRPCESWEAQAIVPSTQALPLLALTRFHASTMFSRERTCINKPPRPRPFGP